MKLNDHQLLRIRERISEERARIESERLAKQKHQRNAKAKVPDASLNCQHRSEYVDEVRCTICSGVVMAKVFECTIHGRCTLFTRPLVESVKSCRTCTDRQPVEGRSIDN